jgi:hypothetical protein
MLGIGLFLFLCIFLHTTLMVELSTTTSSNVGILLNSTRLDFTGSHPIDISSLLWVY